MNRREFLKAAMLVGPVVVATPWVVDYLRDRDHTGLLYEDLNGNLRCEWWPKGIGPEDYDPRKYVWKEYSLKYHIEREQVDDGLYSALSGVTKAMRGV